MKLKRQYSISELPYQADNSQFEIPYTPEKFTQEEIRFLTPFFTNIDKPLFVVKNLPSEVKGALGSRYSRSTKSLRRLFITEYINPLIHPEEHKDWETLSAAEKKEAQRLKKLVFEWIEFVEKNGDMETVVNVQRGRAFFDKWLAQYGDDSIAELGAELVCIEGLSNIATKEMQDKRIGISPLEKSSRYVQFWDKRPDGAYQYLVPGEIKGTKLEKQFVTVMDELFSTYATIAEPYLQYIKELYPQESDETERSFHNSRSAKRFDDIRDLLPFATQTNVAMYGNGRAFEDLLTRLLAHPLGELRWWGQLLLQELSKVVPSFVTRSQTQRGAQAQLYRRNINILRNELAEEVLKTFPKTLASNKMVKKKQWANLVWSTPKAEDVVIATYLFSKMDTVPLTAILKQVKKMGSKKKAAMLQQILTERQFGAKEAKREADRFRKVPRAFENATFLFELWGRGGDYRDLHRHRQATQERQLFTTRLGYDLEKEVVASQFMKQFEKVYAMAVNLFEKIHKVSPEVAQYAVPYGFLQHWYMQLTAREVYWMVEIRTGPQGRPHYRQICQQITIEAKKANPALFQNILVDMNDYSLSRRESEKKIDKKLKALQK